MKTLYPNLDEFFGTYFHQDWREDSANALAIVKRYLAEWPHEEIRAAAQELGRLLAQTATDAELAETLAGFGSFYNPQADGLSYMVWLRQVYQLMTSRVDG